MEEIKYVPLSKFEIEPSLDDKFWEEKVKRSIQECNSVSALKKWRLYLHNLPQLGKGVYAV